MMLREYKREISNYFIPEVQKQRYGHSDLPLQCA